MPLFNRVVPLVLAALLSACIELPEVEEPDAGNPRAGFELEINPSQVAIPQGGSHVFQVSVTRKDGFDGSVSIMLLNPPPGIAAEPVTLSSGSTTASLPISIEESVAPATKTLTLRGTAAGSLPADTSITITVLHPGDLLVRWGSPTQGKIYVNGVLPLSVSVEGGTADSLEFLKESTVLAQLTAPPYQFNWDTTHEAESTYQIVARAKRGNSMFTSLPLSVVVDRTAPAPVSRTPALDAASVSSKTGIEVIFSESLKPASVTASSVVVSTESISSIEKTVTLSPDGRRLTISPTEPLPVPSTVTISLGTSTEPLTDLAGNPALAQPWTFTVPEWLPVGGALSAVSGATSAGNVAMQFGPDGNPIVAWSEADGSSKSIYIQKWDGVQWQLLGGALSALPGNNTPAEHPAMVIDSAGRPIVVWDEATDISPQSTIDLHARQWTGQAWEPLPPFPAFSGSESQRVLPAIAIDSSDTFFVTAQTYNGAGYALGVFQLDRTNNNWVKRSLLIPSEHINPANPSMAIYGPGKFYIAYDVYVENLSARGIAVTTESWVQLGNGLIVNPSSKRAITPRISVSSKGTPYIAWQETNTQTDSTMDGIIYAARWNGSWQPLGISVSTSSSPNVQPALAIGLDDNPIIAWSEYASNTRSIRVNRWTGTAWQPVGPPLSALSGEGTDASNPALATDSTGQPWVAWHEFDGTASNIYVYRLNH